LIGSSDALLCCNEICKSDPEYRTFLFSIVPSLLTIDGQDRYGRQSDDLGGGDMEGVSNDCDDIDDDDDDDDDGHTNQTNEVLERRMNGLERTISELVAISQQQLNIQGSAEDKTVGATPEALADDRLAQMEKRMEDLVDIITTQQQLQLLQQQQQQQQQQQHTEVNEKGFSDNHEIIADLQAQLEQSKANTGLLEEQVEALRTQLNKSQMQQACSQDTIKSLQSTVCVLACIYKSANYTAQIDHEAAENVLLKQNSAKLQRFSEELSVKYHQLISNNEMLQTSLSESKVLSASH
jgi:hypothetical protein